MNGLNGKRVSLDLEALNQLCGKCLHDLDELENSLTNAKHEPYPHPTVQLLARQALQPRVAARIHYA